MKNHLNDEMNVIDNNDKNDENDEMIDTIDKHNNNEINNIENEEIHSNTLQQSNVSTNAIRNESYTTRSSTCSTGITMESKKKDEIKNDKIINKKEKIEKNVILSPPKHPNRLEMSSWDVNSGVYTRVYLRVHAKTRFGEEIHVSGSSFTMGQYNPNESTTLVTTPTEYPYWYTLKPLILPRGVPHRYMYALFTGGKFLSWEPIEHDRILIPEGREMTIQEDYGDHDESLALQVISSPVMSESTKNNDNNKLNSNTNGSHSVIYSRVRVNSEDRGAGGGSGTGGDDELEVVDESSMSRSSSTQGPLSRTQSGYYRRYLPANFRPSSPNSTLFIVCYHLPVNLTYNSKLNTWSAEWNTDSLIAKSENSISNCMEVIWIGCVTSINNNEKPDLTDNDKDKIMEILSNINCVPIFIENELSSNHYQGYCKSLIWPMFHNVDILDINSSIWETNDNSFNNDEDQAIWWDSYQKVNKLIAEKVAVMSKTGDTIWVHDYHLLLFASYFTTKYKELNINHNKKKRRPSMVFFLHVPFPTSEIFRELSNGPRLLEGVLSVDVVGFHSFDHARHFLNACKRFLGLSYQSRRGGNLGVNYHGRNVVVTISHVGIETVIIDKTLSELNTQIMSEATKIKEKFEGKILIGGIDDLQRLSGIPLKLLVFEQFLNIFPVWKDKIVLIQKCCGSDARKGDQEYSSNEIKQLVSRITSKHGPVIDYEEHSSVVPLAQRLPLWLACDILLVTSIRGGLNLKPLEYMYAKVKDAGVVILSEFSACCCVMNGALRINPWNITEVMNALDQALTMSKEERQGRRARDLPYITMQPAANWTKQVLSVLQEATEDNDDSNDGPGDEECITDMEHTHLPHSHIVRTGKSTDFKLLDISKILQAYNSSKRRLFLLDYGGTIIAREKISMYVKKDFTAVSGKVPTQSMMDALGKLCGDPQNTVYVISGVSQVNLSNVLGHIEGLGLAAQNGALYSWAESMNNHHLSNNQDSNSSNEPQKNPVHQRHWHHQRLDYNWAKVRERVDPILKRYTTRTNGSTLKYNAQGIAWNYRSTDPEWGLMQANSLHNELELHLIDFPVTVIRKKGLLEIVPEGLNKGVVARHILAQDALIHKHHPDFLFCIGDDTTDESMFKAIYDYYAERSDESVHGNHNLNGNNTNEGSFNHMFTCTVGKKPSNAHLYVNEVDDVRDLLTCLGNSSYNKINNK